MILRKLIKEKLFSNQMMHRNSKCDKIIGISKETPILELLEKVFRDYKPAPFSFVTHI